MAEDHDEGLWNKRLTRRSALKLVAMATGVAAIPSALAACGPDDAESFNATARARAGGGGEGAATAAGGGGGTTSGGGQANVVEMNDQLKFVPDQLTINVGDTVTWRVIGFVPHTTTCDPSKAMNPDQHVKLPSGAEPWDSGNLNQGQEFSHTFTVAGEYTYFCIPHEAAGMIGHITVS